MKKLKRILVVTFVILLTQVFNIQAACYWDVSTSQTDCGIWCVASGSEIPEDVMALLDEKWNERVSCHAEGIYLKLWDGMNYPNFIVKANWFTAQVKVKELIFGAGSVTTIEVNAFNSTALKYVTKLVFSNMGVDRNPINKGIFNGLESLEVLVMEGAKLNSIENGVFDVLNETLKQFTLKESSKYWSAITIDGFTGGPEPLKALEYVNYKYNLKDTLTHRSFVGLQYVKTLDLSECQIVAIGANAFDPISNSITELNLKTNQITTLPEGIFYYMLPNPVLIIKLDGNRWDCQCHLLPLKTYLMENSNFDGTIKCSTPSNLNGQSIVAVNFCDTYVPSSTTTTQSTPSTTRSTPSSTRSTSIKTSTTTSSTITTIDISSPTVELTTNNPTEPSIPEEFSQTCYEANESKQSQMVFIKTPSAILTVNENADGDVILEVDTVIKNSVLIWFSLVDRETYITASEEITCVIGAQNSIPVYNLREETAYTFCLMDSTEKTVSPLDCISYTKRHVGYTTPWLLNSSKSLIISMAVVACSISALIGLAIGRYALKTNQIFKRRNQNQNAINNVCINEVLKETFQSNNIVRQQQNRMSNMTANSFNTKRTTNLTIDYYIDHNDIAPPLPARPPSMDPFEEPIYAMVRDTGIEKRA